MILRKIVLGVVASAMALSLGLAPALAAETGLSWTSYDSGAHGFSVKFPFKNITKTNQYITPEGATQKVPMTIFMSTEGNNGPFGVTTYDATNWPLAQKLKPNTVTLHDSTSKDVATKLLKGIFAAPELKNLVLRTSKTGLSTTFNFELNSTYFAGTLTTTRNNMMYVVYHNYSQVGSEANVYNEFINSFVAK